MKRLRKWTARILLGLLALALLGLLSINLYLGSDGVKARISQSLSRKLGAPVELKRVSYLPLRGFLVSGFRIPQRADVAAQASEPFLSAKEIIVKLRLWTLLRRPLEIVSLTCYEPVITCAQDANTGPALPWQLPIQPNQPPLLAATPPPPVAIAQPPLPPAAAPPLPAPKAIPPPAVPPLAPPQAKVLVKNARVVNGSFRLLAASGKQALVEVRGINTTLGGMAGPSQPGTLGQIEIAEASALKIFRAEAIRSEVQWRDGAMLLPKVTGRSDGGNLEAVLALHVGKPGLPFEIKGRAQGITIAPMAKRASNRIAFRSGHAQAEFAALGLLQVAASWRGAAIGEVKDAKLARHGIVESLGRQMRLEEFVELAFETATAKLAIAGPQLQVQDIHLKTQNLEFKGVGTVSLAQQLNLAGRLYFSQKLWTLFQRIEQRLPRSLSRESDQLEGRDDYYRDFLISGSMDNPRVDFFGEAKTLPETLKLLQDAAQ